MALSFYFFIALSFPLCPICIVALQARSAKGRVLALTDTGYLRYNVKLQGLYPKGGFFHAENLPAQEAPQKKGAWFQKENVR